MTTRTLSNLQRLAVTLICATHADGFSPSRSADRVYSTYLSVDGRVNGDAVPIIDNINLTAQLDPDAIMPLAPQLTFDKYLTMQVRISWMASGEYFQNETA